MAPHHRTSSARLQLARPVHPAELEPVRHAALQVPSQKGNGHLPAVVADRRRRIPVRFAGPAARTPVATHVRGGRGGRIGRG